MTKTESVDRINLKNVSDVPFILLNVIQLQYMLSFEDKTIVSILGN